MSQPCKSNCGRQTDYNGGFCLYCIMGDPAKFPLSTWITLPPGMRPPTSTATPVDDDELADTPILDVDPWGDCCQCNACLAALDGDYTGECERGRNDEEADALDSLRHTLLSSASATELQPDTSSLEAPAVMKSIAKLVLTLACTVAIAGASSYATQKWDTFFAGPGPASLNGKALLASLKTDNAWQTDGDKLIHPGWNIEIKKGWFGRVKMIDRNTGAKAEEMPGFTADDAAHVANAFDVTHSAAVLRETEARTKCLRDRLTDTAAKPDTAKHTPVTTAVARE